MTHHGGITQTVSPAVRFFWLVRIVPILDGCLLGIALKGHTNFLIEPPAEINELASRSAKWRCGRLIGQEFSSARGAGHGNWFYLGDVHNVDFTEARPKREVLSGLLAYNSTLLLKTLDWSKCCPRPEPLHAKLPY